MKEGFCRSHTRTHTHARTHTHTHTHYTHTTHPPAPPLPPPPHTHTGRSLQRWPCGSRQWCCTGWCGTRCTLTCTVCLTSLPLMAFPAPGSRGCGARLFSSTCVSITWVTMWRVEKSTTMCVAREWIISSVPTCPSSSGGRWFVRERSS
jgi:hypothetical protein